MNSARIVGFLGACNEIGSSGVSEVFVVLCHVRLGNSWVLQGISFGFSSLQKHVKNPCNVIEIHEIGPKSCVWENWEIWRLLLLFENGVREGERWENTCWIFWSGRECEMVCMLVEWLNIEWSVTHSFQVRCWFVKAPRVSHGWWVTTRGRGSTWGGGSNGGGNLNFFLKLINHHESN
jgi:hypothetical protein